MPLRLLRDLLPLAPVLVTRGVLLPSWVLPLQRPWPLVLVLTPLLVLVLQSMRYHTPAWGQMLDGPRQQALLRLLIGAK